MFLHLFFLLMWWWCQGVYSFSISTTTSITTTHHHKAPIVFASECDQLKTQLAETRYGNRFLLMTDTDTQALNTTIQTEPVKIRDTLRFILQVSLLMRHLLGVPVIQIDTTYSKHLSNNESHNVVVQYSNMVRGFFQGGMGDIRHHDDWVVVENKQYKKYTRQATDLLRFLDTFSIKTPLTIDNYYIGHCAVNPQYEKQMTRVDSISNKTYLCSSHFLWVKNISVSGCMSIQTTLKQVENPIGIFVGDDTSRNDLIHTIKTLNPENEHSKITLIIDIRQMRLHFPPIVDAIQQHNLNVVWCCKPSCQPNLHQFLRLCQKNNIIVGGIYIQNYDLSMIQFLIEYLQVFHPKTKISTHNFNRFSL